MNQFLKISLCFSLSPSLSFPPSLSPTPSPSCCFFSLEKPNPYGMWLYLNKTVLKTRKFRKSEANELPKFPQLESSGMESLFLIQPTIQGVICALVNFGPGVECCCEVCAKSRTEAFLVQMWGLLHQDSWTGGIRLPGRDESLQASNWQETDFSVSEWTQSSSVGTEKKSTSATY